MHVITANHCSTNVMYLARPCRYPRKKNLTVFSRQSPIDIRAAAIDVSECAVGANSAAKQALIPQFTGGACDGRGASRERNIDGVV